MDNIKYIVVEQDSDWNWINRIDMYEWEKKCNSMMAKTSLQKLVFQYLLSYLILIRYCASATDSALPEMVMVRSMFPPDSRSSQFEIRIMAPLNCLKNKKVIKIIYKYIVRIRCISHIVIILYF